jgi:hypothetical protein
VKTPTEWEMWADPDTDLMLVPAPHLKWVHWPGVDQRTVKRLVEARPGLCVVGSGEGEKKTTATMGK